MSGFVSHMWPVTYFINEVSLSCMQITDSLWLLNATELTILQVRSHGSQNLEYALFDFIDIQNI